MPLSVAQNRAWNLAQALMIPMIVIEIDDEDFAVIESRDFEGDADRVVREYDPFAH